jgi:cytochrome c551/c552
MYKNIVILLIFPLSVLLVGTFFNKSADSNDQNVVFFQATNPHLFATADACMSCHNGLVTPSGEDISFGTDWSATMMANSARDPYWHAAVRREIMDHPESQVHIESECSTCHMPMAHYEAKYGGNTPDIFSNLPINQAMSRQNLLAADGVSCTTCHQITEENLGAEESFVGRFGLDTLTALGQREVYGPYAVDGGRQNIMHSSSGFLQAESKHIQLSETCATCHTLITESLGPDGEVVGELPEQVPYQEWQHSSFVDKQSCQSCHMPVVKEEVAISSVMGQPREEVSRHTFKGGNFFMLKMLNRYRNDLGVKALPREMDDAVNRTVDHLQNESAKMEFGRLEIDGDELLAEVNISNLAGHKLPTAYPSRRTWIHFTVTDDEGTALYESGAVRKDGSIVGNDNDEDATTFEPHYTEITEPGQVQIYETIMVDPQENVTTGLLTAVRFIKDNRILPEGFDKETADEWIEVHGAAFEDEDFLGGGDQITYRVKLSDAQRPLHIKAELWYQPIGYRWAQNLSDYDAEETNRFVGYFDSMSKESALKLTEFEAKYNQE